MYNFNTLNKRFYSTPSYFYLSSLKLDNLKTRQPFSPHYVEFERFYCILISLSHTKHIYCLIIICLVIFS